MIDTRVRTSLAEEVGWPRDIRTLSFEFLCRCGFVCSGTVSSNHFIIFAFCSFLRVNISSIETAGRQEKTTTGESDMQIVSLCASHLLTRISGVLPSLMHVHRTRRTS